MTERQYNDEEIETIFRVATEGSESPTAPGGRAGGLALRDLQAIAREVGISPDAVARAAQSLEGSPQQAASRTFLGLPVGVERTVTLDRFLTDAEWELLVTQLRDVFRARGTVRTYGSLREWSNGNLHALLEPTATGHQLRLSTFKSGTRGSIGAGMLILGVSVAVGITAAAQGTLAASLPGLSSLATVGAALAASGAFRLPRWARTRRRQMDNIVTGLMLAPHAERQSHAVLPEPSDDQRKL